MLKVNQIKRRDLISLLLILFVATVMHLGEPGVVEFFHDEAMVSILAQEMADGETFPTRGIVSSVGIPNPPTSIWVMAIPYIFTSDPMVATLFVATLNILGFGLQWFIAHRYFSPTVGLISGIADALTPWGILYSRKIWAQDYHTPLILLALLVGLHGFGEGKKWAQALCLPLLLFSLQIHFSAWALLPLYLCLVWIGRNNLSKRALVISVILGALVLLPYGVGLVQTFQEQPNLLSNLNREETGFGLSGDALRYTFFMATGLGLETWVAPLESQRFLANVPEIPVLWYLGGLLTLIGLPVVWLRYRALAPFVLIWALLPTLIFTPTWTKVYPHYFIGAIPAYTLLTAIGLEGVIRATPNRQITRPALVSLFAVVMLTQGLWWRGTLRYVNANEIGIGPGTSGFTTPVHYLLEVRDAVRGYDDVVVVTDGMWVLFDAEAARWPSILRDQTRCVRTLPGDGYAVFPDEPFAVITAPNAPENAIANLYITPGTHEIETRDGSSGYSVTLFENAPVWNGPEITPIDPVRFDNGVTLTGFAANRNRVVLEWALPEAPSRLFFESRDYDYQYFAHLLDENGQTLQQRDTSFWPGRHWCAGDRLLTWQALDQNMPRADIVRVGMYKLGHNPGEYSSFNVLDAMGNPAGQWVDLPIPDRRATE